MLVWLGTGAVSSPVIWMASQPLLSPGCSKPHTPSLCKHSYAVEFGKFIRDHWWWEFLFQLRLPWFSVRLCTDMACVKTAFVQNRWSFSDIPPCRCVALKDRPLYFYSLLIWQSLFNLLRQKIQTYTFHNWPNNGIKIKNYFKANISWYRCWYISTFSVI